MNVAMRLVLASLLLCATRASAQVLTEAQAVAAVKAAGKLEVKLFKVVTKAAIVQLDAELDAIEADLSPETQSAALVGSVADIVFDLLEACDDALFSAVDGIAAATADALLEMDGPLEGHFPAALYYGSSGPLDDSLTSLRKAAAKVRDAVDKRLQKVVAKAGKSGIGLTAFLQWPRALDFEPIDEGDTELVGRGPELEFAVAGGRFDTPDDGAMLAVGVSDDTFTSLDVDIIDSGGAVDSVPAFFTEGSQHFFGAPDVGMAEGNYVMGVTQGTGPRHSLIPFGIP